MPHATKVAVLGGSGYTALELLKILARHPSAEVVAVTSREAAPIGDTHPQLLGRLAVTTEPFDADALQAKGVEVAFGCLPHGASAEAVAPLLARGIRVVDLSADYRLKDGTVHQKWYGEPHADPANVAHAAYGLPEMYAAEIRTARLVANPGCYPQTGILGLLPLVRRGLVRLDDIVVDSYSGVSGAGRTPKLTTHFPECNESLVAYGVGTHRHTPEIEQALSHAAGRPVEVVFTPHLAPIDRGIQTTIYATPTRPVTDAELLAVYREEYAAAPFVRVRTVPPATKDAAHTNFLDVCPRAVRGRVVVLVAEDNLVRGASGVAVQNFNLMAGRPETTGLL